MRATPSAMLRRNYLLLHACFCSAADAATLCLQLYQSPHARFYSSDDIWPLYASLILMHHCLIEFALNFSRCCCCCAQYAWVGSWSSAPGSTSLLEEYISMPLTYIFAAATAELFAIVPYNATMQMHTSTMMARWRAMRGGRDAKLTAGRSRHFRHLLRRPMR